MIMAAACLASFAILAGSLAAIYGLDWYRSRRRNRRLTRKVEEEQEYSKELVEQLA
jgi:hypothetical protein